MQLVLQLLGIALSLTAIGLVYDTWRTNRQNNKNTHNHTSARRCHDPHNNVRR